MKNFFLIIFVTFFSNVYGFKTNQSIIYTVSSVEKDSIPMLKIQATFEANATGITDLSYDNYTWGNRNLFNCIVAPRIIGEKAKITLERDSSRIRIHHAPNVKTLNFEYFLKQDTEGDLNMDNYYRPIIQKDYFHIFSLELFIVPEAAKDTLFDITLSWKDFSTKYIVHNNYGPIESTQKLTNITINDFLEGICVGGDYRVRPLTARGGNASFVTRGKYTTLREKDIKNLLDETVNALDRFWKKEDNEFLTVILSTVKVDFNGSTNGGMGFNNSFDAFCSDNQYTSMEQLVSLFTHELIHQWIGLTIENDNEEEQYWFSEGFTTYYTAKLIAKNRIHQLDGSFFINEINNIIKQHYSSSVKNSPNAALTKKRFWGDRNYEKIPYNRGALFAFYLDQKIQKDSNKKLGLDDVMRTILKEAKISKQKLTHSYFIETVNHFLTYNIKADFKRYIEDGKVIKLEGFFKSNSLAYKPVNSELKLMGLEMGGVDGKQIISIEENSDAKEAGFRVGDKLLNYEENPESSQKVVYTTVKRNGKIIEISLIRTAKVINVPQLLNTAQNFELIGL